jgi:hypothetical protein
MATLSCIFLFLSLLQATQVSDTKQKPPEDSHFSILDIAIGKDNLQTLQNKLGPTKKCQTKQHEGVSIAGYASPDEDVIFEFGDAGGGDVTAFFLALPTRKIGCRLSPLPPRGSPLATHGGVHLGMTEHEFVKMFGVPEARSRSGRWKYDWTLEVKYTEEERKAASAAGHAVPADTYLVGIIVEAQFARGVLQYFYISKTETT